MILIVADDPGRKNVSLSRRPVHNAFYYIPATVGSARTLDGLILRCCFQKLALHEMGMIGC
jgi:hypothetical protein